jgi:hypothetical protein
MTGSLTPRCGVSPAALAVIRIGYFMVILDTTVSNVALPWAAPGMTRLRDRPGQWLRSAAMSWDLLIEDRPLTPISLARLIRSALVQFW